MEVMVILITVAEYISKVFHVKVSLTSSSQKKCIINYLLGVVNLMIIKWTQMTVYF